MKGEISMEVKRIGTFEFGDVIDITDPCLEPDNVNRMHGVRIVPGVYNCDVMYDGNRIQSAEINLKSLIDGFVGNLEFDIIGKISIFSGVAGFFYHDMNFTDEGWDKFCDTIEDNNAWIDECGFCASTDHLEDCFHVLAHKNENGEVDALNIQFFVPDCTE